MIELTTSRISGGTVPGVMEEVCESSEEELSGLRSRIGEELLMMSADDDGVALSSFLIVPWVLGLLSPCSGWDERMEDGFGSSAGALRNGTGGKTFSTI